MSGSTWMLLLCFRFAFRGKEDIMAERPVNDHKQLQKSATIENAEDEMGRGRKLFATMLLVLAVLLVMAGGLLPLLMSNATAPGDLARWS